MNETLQPVRLLIVEDSPGDARLLESLLEALGQPRYEFVVAVTLAKAKAAVAREAFDAVLLDLHLPDADGLATIDGLRAAAPAVPILVMTGGVDERTALEAVSRGADDYLVKGKSDAGLLARAIRYAIDRKRAQAALRQAHDELEQKVRDRTVELAAANQTLRMISECNEALVRAIDEYALIKDICQIIVSVGGYRMAWVGYAENDADKTVEVVAAVGFDEGYLKHVRVSWADQPRGRGPTGTCIRTAQVCIGHDFATEPALAPWREEALKRGYRSSIALPLMAFGKAFGALTLYSEAPGFFDEGRVTLLRELADDLAFGVIALRAQVERDHARAVSDRRAEQLRALASELTLTEQRERRRLAQILHDHLQQLLVGVKLNIGVLRSKAKTKTLQQPIDQISDMMNEAIRAARSLTAELSPPVLHEKGLAAGLEWLGRQMQEKHGLEVEVAAHPDAEPDAESTRIFLFGAVRELLFNIVKHAGTNRARVSLVRQDSQIRVTVADDGVGFDPGHLEDRAGEAGGFGLFSIRERLGFMGGYLEIDSAPARGSRFTLVAPLRRRGAPETAVALPAAPPAIAANASAPRTGLLVSIGRKIRVLLADDHAVMRQGLAALLQEERDIEVIGQAADGWEALELARLLKPDVVIMDVTMPRLGGLDATRLISAEMPEVRVVGLSLHDAADMAKAMHEAGARTYLSKSDPVEDLIAAIRGC